MICHTCVLWKKMVQGHYLTSMLSQDVSENSKQLTELENFFDSELMSQLDNVYGKVGTIERSAQEAFNVHSSWLSQACQNIAETRSKAEKIWIHISNHAARLDWLHTDSVATREVLKDISKIARENKSQVGKPCRSWDQLVPMSNPLVISSLSTYSPSGNRKLINGWSGWG